MELSFANNRLQKLRHAKIITNQIQVGEGVFLVWK